MAAAAARKGKTLSAADRALFEIAKSDKSDVEQLLALIGQLCERFGPDFLDIEDEASANELLAQHGKLFSFWVCVIDADDKNIYESLVPVAAHLFDQVGKLASLEAFRHVSFEARMRYVDVITARLKAEIESEVAKPSDLVIFLSIEGWLRTDVLDIALKENGLIATVCELILDQTKSPSSKTMDVWLCLLVEVAMNAIMRTAAGDNVFRLALSRGVVRAAIRAADHPHASPDVAASLLRVIANMAPVIVKALQEGTELRRMADSVLAAGVKGPAKAELRKLLELEKLHKIARSIVATSGAETSSANPAITIGSNMCRHCSATQAALKCSKCLQAYYCNKDCQRQDWKEHKTTCRTAENRHGESAPLRDSSTFPTKLATGYVLVHEDQLELDLMQKRFELCSTEPTAQPLELNEVVVALNLDTLTHTILVLADVQRWRNIPAWIVDEAQSSVLALLASMHPKLLPGMWLAVVRAAGAFPAFSVYRFHSADVRGHLLPPAPRRAVPPS